MQILTPTLGVDRIVPRNDACGHVDGLEFLLRSANHGQPSAFDEKVPPGALAIQIFPADHTAYSKKLQRVVMMRDALDHSRDDFVLLSGTRVREKLESGETLPVEFARPEVARILMDYYRDQKPFS